MPNLVEKCAKGIPCLLRQRQSPFKLRTDRCWLSERSCLSGLIVDDRAIESAIVLKVAQAIQSGDRRGQCTLEEISGFAELMELEAPSVERDSSADHRDNLIEVVIIRVHHQNLSVPQFAMQAIDQRHQVQGIRSCTRGAVQGSLPSIVASNSKRNTYGNHNSNHAADRLHPGGLNLWRKAAPTNQFAIHVDSPVDRGEA